MTTPSKDLEMVAHATWMQSPQIANLHKAVDMGYAIKDDDVRFALKTLDCIYGDAQHFYHEYRSERAAVKAQWQRIRSLEATERQLALSLILCVMATITAFIIGWRA